MMRESLRALPLWVLYGFLYLPILVVVGMSFNANDSAYRWTGFSLQWYPELLRDASILGGLRTTLIVAVGTTAISVVLGTLLAMALERYVPSRALDAAAAAPARRRLRPRRSRPSGVTRSRSTPAAATDPAAGCQATGLRRRPA